MVPRRFTASWEECILRKLVMILLMALVPSLAMAATPSEGVPLKVRRGFFTELGIGGLFTVGGADGYSNLQSYLQLGAGYQFSLSDEKIAIPVGFTVGIGANAANCHGDKTAAGDCAEPDNFTITFLTASGGVLYSVFERFYVGGRALVGYTLIDPPAVSLTDGSRFDKGINLGAAFATEYATEMDHFTVGVDIGYRMVLPVGVQANIIHTLHFVVRVKYTF